MMETNNSITTTTTTPTSISDGLREDNVSELLHFNDDNAADTESVGNGKADVPPLELSGRDSGISIESPRYQELNTKVSRFSECKDIFKRKRCFHIRNMFYVLSRLKLLQYKINCSH